MPNLRVQHTFQGSSGVPEDRFVNVFYINTPTMPDEPGFVGLSFAFKAFYETAGVGASGPIRSWLASNIDGVGKTIKFYDMADPLPRSPKYVFADDIAITTDIDNLPSEVALCLSYAAVPVSGEPVARRRGRLYIGPFNVTAVSDNTDNNWGRPALNLQTSIVAAGEKLAADLLAIDSTAWQVYSPTDNQFMNIVRCWVDNSWDTQRRRGAAPTSRVTRTF